MTEESLNYSFELSGLGCSNAADLPALPRHRWYFVKEAFSPVLVERALVTSGCEAGDVVLDPFCGSGTSLLAASSFGARSTGCEVNPFLAFVSRTKLRSVSPHTLRRRALTVQNGAACGKISPLEGMSTFTPTDRNQKGLFNTKVVRAFEGGWSACENMPTASRDLLRLALIGAAMDCCNAKRDGKCLRYRKDWEAKGFDGDNVLERFSSRVSEMLEDLEAEAEPPVARVLQGDSRRKLSKAKLEPFRLCITSPPYLNSFDYTDIYRPEMFLGKFTATAEQLRAVRLRTLRSHVQASWRRPRQTEFGPLYASSMESLQERVDSMWDSRIPVMVQAYFEDMQHVLTQLKGHARPGAQLWLVVSTSAYAGVVVPVDLIIADIACRVGWSLQEVGVIRSLRSSGQHLNSLRELGNEAAQLRESVVMLSMR